MNSCAPPQLVARGPCDGNLILASLRASTRLPSGLAMQQVDLASGTRLHEVGATLRHVYLPTTAIVSLVSELRDGASAEVALIGAEGIVGVSACMGGATAHDTAVVQAAGKAWRMDASTFVRQAWRNKELMRPVLRYGQALMTQIAQTSTCNCLHGLERRLCRWLLSMLDRRPGDKVLVTHERMAAILGVRREGVTAAAFRLQRVGLIRYQRGELQVLDRAGLEACSCECHALMRAALNRYADDVRTECARREVEGQPRRVSSLPSATLSLVTASPAA